jgi:hypothetical protein
MRIIASSSTTKTRVPRAGTAGFSGEFIDRPALARLRPAGINHRVHGNANDYSLRGGFRQQYGCPDSNMTVPPDTNPS